MKKYVLIIFLYSCTIFKHKTVTLPNGKVVPVMTNSELTRRVVIDSIDIKKIKDNYAYPDKNFRIDTLGNMGLADTIFINAIVTNGRLYVGAQGTKSSCEIENEKIKEIIKDATFVRTYLERLTDSLFRSNDSLRSIIDSR